MNRVRASGLLAFLIAVSISAPADEDFFSAVDVAIENEEEQGSSLFEYKGYVQQILKYGLSAPDSNFAFERDESGVSKFRTDAFVEFRGSFSDSLRWQLSGKAELDWIRWRDGEMDVELNRETFRLKDAYLDWTLSNNTWIRAGHQIFAWGESEGLAITDVLSPVDSREPGQAELQDLREQVPAVLLSTPVASSKLSFVVTYEAGHDRFGERDEDFYPYIALKNSGAVIDRRSPEDQWEYALKWDKQFNGGDVAFVAADVNDNQFSLDSVLVDAEIPTMVFSQERVRIVGLGGTKVVGSWLFKGEGARYSGQPVPNRQNIPWQKETEYRGMIGTEYSGIDDLTLSFEANSIYNPNLEYPADVTFEKVRKGYVLRVSHNSLNERLNNQFWVINLANGDATVYRYTVAYDINDNFEMELGAVIYSSNEKSASTYPFRENDSANLSVRYSF